MQTNTNNPFDDLATQWWSLDGPMKTLHEINPTRHKWITDNIGEKSAKILDIGCGAGILAESLAKSAHLVTGLDISDKLIKIAKSHAEIESLKIKYIAQNIDDFAPSNTESFDYVTCLELLEHVEDPEKFIAAAAHCCKKNGKIFFSTLNRNLKSWLLSICVAEHLLGIIPKGTHSYSHFIKPSEIYKIAKKHNLELLKTTGMTYNPISKTAKLTSSLKINYLLCFQKKA